MSVWLTRSLERPRNYIVLQHTLKGVNHTVNGIKFRDGYAVVEKDSKVYLNLKKIPVLRASKEYPLTHLKKLPFITRTSDIRTVYGQDVYVKFLEEAELEAARLEQEKEQKRIDELKAKADLEKQLAEAQIANNETLIEEIKSNIPIIVKCCYTTQDGTLCKEDAVEHSPSGHCNQHLLEDPRLAQYGFEVPKFMTKDERRAFRSKVKEGMKKAKAQGKF